MQEIHLTLVGGLKTNPELGRVYNVALEYGQYYSNESEEIKSSNENFKIFGSDFFPLPCLIITESNHYGISVEECMNDIKNLSSISDYHLIECEVGKNITLRELCDNFKGKN